MKTLTLRGSLRLKLRPKRLSGFLKRYTTSGYLPRTFAPLQALGRFLANLWIFIQVGRITLINKALLQTTGPVIFCANHSSMFDPLILMAILRRLCRYMTAIEEMQGLFGLKAVLMGSFGSFAVDRTRGKTAIAPAIKVLADKQALVIFPEGKISPTGELLPFKAGAALIAQGAYDLMARKQEVLIVPVSLNYKGRDKATACSSFGEMGFRWRRGVTAIVSPALPVSAYVGDIEAITEAIRKSIASNLENTDDLS